MSESCSVAGRGLSVLWWDDRPSSIDDVVSRFKEVGADVNVVQTWDDAVDEAKRNGYDALFFDLRRDRPGATLEKTAGMDYAGEAAILFPDKLRVLVTGFYDDYVSMIRDGDVNPFDFLIRKDRLREPDAVEHYAGEIRARIPPRVSLVDRVGKLEALGGAAATIVLYPKKPGDELSRHELDSEFLRKVGIRQIGDHLRFEVTEETREGVGRIDLVIRPVACDAQRALAEPEPTEPLESPDLSKFPEHQDA